MNKMLIYLFIIVASFNCASQNKIQINNQKIAYEKQKLKNVAFCYCLTKSMPSLDSIINQDGSVAGYFETSCYRIDVFQKLDSLAAEYSKKIYKSKDKNIQE
jgi:hypothetical protein